MPKYEVKLSYQGDYVVGVVAESEEAAIEEAQFLAEFDLPGSIHVLEVVDVIEDENDFGDDPEDEEDDFA